jgi:hypothetical protein
MEVRVLGDDDRPALSGAAPDQRIGRLVQRNIADMERIGEQVSERPYQPV